MSKRFMIQQIFKQVLYFFDKIDKCECFPHNTNQDLGFRNQEKFMTFIFKSLSYETKMLE